MTKHIADAYQQFLRRTDLSADPLEHKRAAFEAGYADGYAAALAEHEKHIRATWQAATLAERERCAKVCEGVAAEVLTEYSLKFVSQQLMECAAAIRGMKE